LGGIAIPFGATLHAEGADDVERWTVALRVFLVDGTYELFRHYYGVPSHRTADGAEVAATRGVLSSMLQLLSDGVTHLGVATDHVIESFRNDMWPGYKSSAGVDPILLGQFGLLEIALEALGVKVWPMIRLEADDAMASAAAVAADDPAVDQVVICTPDKDLGQCVDGGRVVQLDRRKKVVLDEAAVTAKFGVEPKSIPDYLALVGDSSDGYPGLPGWGAKSTAQVLTRYKTIEQIPDAPGQWDVSVRNGPALAAVLASQRADAMLFKDLATLRIDRSLLGHVEELRWQGPTADFAAVCDRIDAPPVAARAARLAQELSS
jgi:5'-3' exonuclease